MTGPKRPPQAESNKAQIAERDAEIYRLRLSGMTERQIAAEVRLSPGRVHTILTEQIADVLGPAAEDYVNEREAELADLYRRAYDVMAKTDDPDVRLKAIARLQAINESRRKIRGADAPEAMMISLEHRADVEAEIVTRAIEAATAALALTPERKMRALEAAACVLEGGDPPPVVEEPEPAAAGPSVIMEANGVRFVIVRGQRFEYAGTGPLPEPPLDGEVISDDVSYGPETADPEEADPTGPARPARPGRSDPDAPQTDAERMKTWPRELRQRAGGGQRIW